jgi:hypothetical protein
VGAQPIIRSVRKELARLALLFVTQT